MRGSLAAIGALLMTFWGITPAVAQSTGPAAAAERGPAATPAPVDPDKLAVNLSRLQRRFRQAVARENFDGERLNFSIDVFAEAPRIQLFTPEDNLRWGPARNSAPTHQDMINIVTPQEFRSPVMNFTNLFRWLGDRSREDK